MGHNRRLGGPEENQIVVVNRQPGKKLSQARTLRRSTSEWSGASKLEETACKPHSTLRAGDVTPGRHPVHSSAERARDGPALSGMRGREKKKKRHVASHRVRVLRSRQTNAPSTRTAVRCAPVGWCQCAAAHETCPFHCCLVRPSRCPMWPDSPVRPPAHCKDARTSPK